MTQYMTPIHMILSGILMAHNDFKRLNQHVEKKAYQMEICSEGGRSLIRASRGNGAKCSTVTCFHSNVSTKLVSAEPSVVSTHSKLLIFFETQYFLCFTSRICHLPTVNSRLQTELLVLAQD